ncbi:unnamed protein product [Paramecium pentaurelia]|uniref:Uncharacterized protein n=1 Tax=Paramecium pentaurelia TaxID=43138 RepID=A0A8S1VIG1_9CILI|nr:unnamed protein product [Paramecium pentaurelia]
MNQDYNQNFEVINEIKLENNLKDLLERVLLNAEKFIDSKEELNQIERELKDYENLYHLTDIIKVVFTNMMMKVEQKLMKLEKMIDPQQTFSMRTDQEYEKLEQNMIKYEVEIRNHIRIEQQLKLYAESIQSKLDESEINRNELLNTTKQLISNLKRENQTYYEVQKKLKNEITSLNQIINGLEKENRRQSQDLSQRDQIKTQNKTNQQTTNLSIPLQSRSQQYKIDLKNEKSFIEQKGNDIPIKSQQSLKQNYYNFINHGNIANKVEVQKLIQSKEVYRGNGQRFKSKNNSLSNIQDIIQSGSVQDRKKGLVSQTISKNSSQENSQIIKYKESGDINRSKSSKRANISQKLILMESQIKLLY